MKYKCEQENLGFSEIKIVKVVFNRLLRGIMQKTLNSELCAFICIAYGFFLQRVKIKYREIVTVSSRNN